MKKLSRILAVLLVVCMILAVIPTAFAEADYSKKTVILHSNDVHGNVAGYAYMAALKADFEAKGAKVILADAGDFSQGTTYVSLSKGANAVEMMNVVGYDVATLGNHEFDYGAGPMFDNLSKAEFKVLCADVLKDGKSIFDATAIIEKGGVKIGFFGLETPEAQTKANPALIQGLTFLTNESDPKLYEEAQKHVDALKTDGADIIVCLSHLGVDESSAPYTSYDLYKNVTGIDFVIDGHSHTVMDKGADGQPIQSTGTAFENIGVIVIDNETKKIDTNFLQPIDAETSPKDEAVAAKAQAIIDGVNAEYGKKFAESKVDLNGAKSPNGNRDSETNNGDLITDAMIWCVTEQYPGSITEVPAENIVAITNGGGIRAAIKTGDVTKNDIFTVLPFGNTVAVVYVTGAELIEALEASTYCTPVSLGGFPQVAGLQFSINTTKAYDANAETYPGSTYYGPKTINRVVIDNINGKAFDPEAKYAVVTNNFCAGGGDTYYAFAAATSQFDTGYTLDTVVMDYITEKLEGVIGEEYAAPQGRITVLNENSFAGKTVILHSNDVHGAIAGYANIAGLKSDYEAMGADVILADAGDYSQGTTYVSLSKGANAVDMMNAAGYDVATLGNHEFDYGADQMFENLGKAKFKVLCADVLKDGKSIFDATAIIEKGGVKIGFFGLETPEAQTKANPALILGLTFLTNESDPKLYEEAQKQVNALKADGADIIVCLSHLGVDASSAPYTSYDLYKNVTGIDFVIDAHSHTEMEKGDKDEPIQSTGTAFANIGVVVIDNATKAIEDNFLTSVNVYTTKDAAVAEKAQKIIDDITAEYGAKFAESKVDLNGAKAPNGNRDSETNNGDLITDAMIWCVTEQYPGSITEVPAENIVAITNGGGIRAAIKTGDVTKNDIFTVLPFGNTVAVVYVTGAELLEALEASTFCTPEAVGGFPQVAGLQFNIDTSKAYDANAETYPGSTYYGPASINRVSIDNINGKAFDPEAKYAVVTNNFCAGGGDTYYAFAAATSQFDTGYTLDTVVMDYITEKLEGVIGEEYAEPQGRITFNAAPLANPFTDVKEGSWYYDYVLKMADKGVIKGMTETTFEPNGDLTRAQVAVMLYRMAGEPKVEKASSFTDVKEGKWYSDAIAWAEANKIVNGMTPTTFEPDGKITRAQLVTMLYRMVGEPTVEKAASFTDVKAGTWYSNAIAWAEASKIVNGMTPTTFEPDGLTTRAQAAKILCLLSEMPK